MTRVRMVIITCSIFAVLMAAGVLFANLEFLQAQADQHRLILEGCDRLNILRAEDNLSHDADFNVFTVVLIQSRASTMRLTAQQQQFQEAFLAQLTRAVKEKSWTPLTNCRQAVSQQGAAYRAPQPIRFVDRRPPLAALHSPRAG